MATVSLNLIRSVFFQTSQCTYLLLLRCSFLILFYSIAFDASAAGNPQRVFKPAPLQTEIQAWHSSERIVIKFAEGTEVRLRNGGFASLRNADLSQVKQVLARHGVLMGSVEPIFDRPEQLLAAEKTRGEKNSGQQLADLNLYYFASLRPHVDAAALCDALNQLEVIESAVPAPLDVEPPTDISPATPDFTGLQGYSSLATGGIGIDEVASIPGTDGTGTAFVDIEFGWILDHEDLELPPSTVIDEATIDNPYNPNHGTAVLGMLVAKDNG